KGGPPPPRADHLPIESGVPCSTAVDQPPNSFRVPLSAEQEARALAVYRRSIVITAHDHCFDPGDFRDMEAAGITVRTIKPTVDGVLFTGAKRYRLHETADG